MRSRLVPKSGRPESQVGARATLDVAPKESILGT